MKSRTEACRWETEAVAEVLLRGDGTETSVVVDEVVARGASLGRQQVCLDGSKRPHALRFVPGARREPKLRDCPGITRPDAYRAVHPRRFRWRKRRITLPPLSRGLSDMIQGTAWRNGRLHRLGGAAKAYPSRFLVMGEPPNSLITVVLYHPCMDQSKDAQIRNFRSPKDSKSSTFFGTLRHFRFLRKH